MRWEQNTCPECGGPAYGVMHEVVSTVMQAEDGTYGWTGDTELDSQCPIRDDDGQEELCCEVGHRWWSQQVETVTCSVCRKEVPATTAHLHQGLWIGDECCWDPRLEASE